VATALLAGEKPARIKSSLKGKKAERKNAAEKKRAKSKTLNPPDAVMTETRPVEPSDSIEIPKENNLMSLLARSSPSSIEGRTEITDNDGRKKAKDSHSGNSLINLLSNSKPSSVEGSSSKSMPVGEKSGKNLIGFLNKSNPSVIEGKKTQRGEDEPVQASQELPVFDLEKIKMQMTETERRKEENRFDYAIGTAFSYLIEGSITIEQVKAVIGELAFTGSIIGLTREEAKANEARDRILVNFLRTIKKANPKLFKDRQSIVQSILLLRHVQPDQSLIDSVSEKLDQIKMNDIRKSDRILLDGKSHEYVIMGPKNQEVVRLDGVESLYLIANSIYLESSSIGKTPEDRKMIAIAKKLHERGIFISNRRNQGAYGVSDEFEEYIKELGMREAIAMALSQGKGVLDIAAKATSKKTSFNTIEKAKENLESQVHGKRHGVALSLDRQNKKTGKTEVIVQQLDCAPCGDGADKKMSEQGKSMRELAKTEAGNRVRVRRRLYFVPLIGPSGTFVKKKENGSGASSEKGDTKTSTLLYDPFYSIVKFQTPTRGRRSNSSRSNGLNSFWGAGRLNGFYGPHYGSGFEKTPAGRMGFGGENSKSATATAKTGLSTSMSESETGSLIARALESRESQHNASVHFKAESAGVSVSANREKHSASSTKTENHENKSAQASTSKLRSTGRETSASRSSQERAADISATRKAAGTATDNTVRDERTFNMSSNIKQTGVMQIEQPEEGTHERTHRQKSNASQTSIKAQPVNDVNGNSPATGKTKKEEKSPRESRSGKARSQTLALELGGALDTTNRMGVRREMQLILAAIDAKQHISIGSWSPLKIPYSVRKGDVERTLSDAAKDLKGYIYAGWKRSRPSDGGKKRISYLISTGATRKDAKTSFKEGQGWVAGSAY